LAANFANWTAEIEARLVDAAERLSLDLDRKALAEFVLTAMEGAVMQARTHRDVAYFDRMVATVRPHFELLMERRARRLAPA
jgi:TetR/AcrR family transcriptional repressor of nem operon